MKLPNEFKLKKELYDKLYALTLWFQNTPDSIKQLFGDDIANMVFWQKRDIVDDISLDSKANYGIIDVEVTDGLLFAVCRDYDGKWDKDMVVQIKST